MPDESPARRRRPPASGPPVLVVDVGDGVTVADVRRIRQDLCDVLERDGSATVLCDLGAVDVVDAGTIEAVARLTLTARRQGRSIRVRGAPRALLDLLELVGLRDVVPVGDDAIR